MKGGERPERSVLSECGAGLHSSRFSNIRAACGSGEEAPLKFRQGTLPQDERKEERERGTIFPLLSKGKAIRGNGLFAPPLPLAATWPPSLPSLPSPASLSTSHDCTFLASSGSGEGHGMRAPLPSPVVAVGLSDYMSVPELNAAPPPSALSLSSSS